MTDNAYISSFGVPRYVGAGEGEELKNRSDIVTEYLFPVKRVITEIDYDKLGLPDGNTLVTGNNGFARGIAAIPAGALVVSATLYVTGAGADGTATVDVGLEEKDGTPIDADGLVDGATIAAGTKTGAGALVGTVLDDEGYVVAAIATGTAANFAGLKGWLVVEYVE
jgi:hypothetical protein